MTYIGYLGGVWIFTILIFAFIVTTTITLWVLRTSSPIFDQLHTSHDLISGHRLQLLQAFKSIQSSGCYNTAHKELLNS